MRNSFETPAAVAVTTTTTILTVDHLDRLPYVNFEVENASATVALSAFKVQLQDHPSGEWYDFITTWTADHYTQLWLSGAPATLAATAKAHAILFIGAAYGMRFVATVASGTGSVKIRGAAGNI